METVSRVVSKEDGKWSLASFRITGDGLRPDQISELLGLEPTQSGVKGERYSTRHNNVRRTSFWLLRCPLGDGLSLTDHLKWLLDILEPKLELINSISQVWEAMLLCGFSSENGQGGFTLDPKTLQRTACLGVPLSINLYPPQSAGSEEKDGPFQEYR